MFYIFNSSLSKVNQFHIKIILKLEKIGIKGSGIYMSILSIVDLVGIMK